MAFPSAKGSGAVTSFSQADGFIEIDALAGCARRRHAGARDLDRRFRPRARRRHHGQPRHRARRRGRRAGRARIFRAHHRGRQPGRRRGGRARPVRCRAGASDRSGDRRIQQAPARAGTFAGQRLAAHAGRAVPAGRQALRGQARRRRGEGRARRSLLPDGQPQRRRRHPRADRQAPRRRAAARLRQPAALAQRRRRRDRAGARRLGRRDRAGGADVWARVPAARPRALRFPAGGEPARAGPRSRHFSRRCATAATKDRIAALGMQPADD